MPSLQGLTIRLLLVSLGFLRSCFLRFAHSLYDLLSELSISCMAKKRETRGSNLYPNHVISRYVDPPEVITTGCAWQVRVFLGRILFVCIVHDLISSTAQDLLQRSELRDIMVIEEIHDWCSHPKRVPFIA